MSAAKKKTEDQLPIELTPARFVKRVTKPDGYGRAQLAAEKKLAGVYRMIHGRVAIPRPESEWKNPDGSDKPGAAKFDYAGVHFTLWPANSGRDAQGILLDGRVKSAEGDEVYFNDLDAMMLLEADVIEPLDSKPSRCGMVWQPPKVIRNAAAMMG